MDTQQRSFHLVKYPAEMSHPHTYLVVSGRGVPHGPLTLFYQEAQIACPPKTTQAIMCSLFAFFSFLEQEAPFLPSNMLGIEAPFEMQMSIRRYLQANWGCRTWQHDEHETILLSHFKQQQRPQILFFLESLQWFYRFSQEKRNYWYASNPAEAFHLCSPAYFRFTILSSQLY